MDGISTTITHIVVSPLGNATLCVLAIIFALSLWRDSSRHNQPWKKLAAVMMIAIAAFYFLAVFGLEMPMMRGGWFNLAFGFFLLFSIFHVNRFLGDTPDAKR